MVSRNQAKLIGKLASRKHREDMGLFLVEGVRLVEELRAVEWPVELAIASPALFETERGRGLAEAMQRSGWSVAEVSGPQLARLSQTESPQGVLVVARQRPRRLYELDPPPSCAVVVLDRLADPGNLGTLARAAYGLGAAWIVALPGTVDPWNPKAVRASAGALFHIPTSFEDWDGVVAWLRERRFDILCADAEGEPVTRGAEAPDRFALVLGNEPGGLSEAALRACDRRVAIALPGRMNSLNVAIAGALLLDRLLAGRRVGTGTEASSSTRSLNHECDV
jgi:TrmH family RNA methyltransferase